MTEQQQRRISFLYPVPHVFVTDGQFAHGVKLNSQQSNTATCSWQSACCQDWPSIVPLAEMGYIFKSAASSEASLLSDQS